MVTNISRRWPAPATLAAVTYSRFFSAITAPRVSRAKCGCSTTAMASMALKRPGPDDRHQHQRQQQRREGEDDVHHPHDQRVDPAAEVAGDQPDEDAGDQRQRHHHEADDQRVARAVDQPREDVAAERVGAEQERRACRPRSRPAASAARRGTASSGRAARSAARRSRSAPSGTRMTRPMHRAAVAGEVVPVLAPRRDRRRPEGLLLGGPEVGVICGGHGD